ncbi:MAG: HAD family phosphatase [Sedimentisphaerales bacterium]|nr:HAD family phosphatase [Sedimentisphaerales bacterium]
MLKAVIFDFDGVITDSEILHFRAFNSVLGEHGIELTTKEYYKSYLGFSDVDCFKLLIQEGRLDVREDEIGGLVRRKGRFYEELSRNEGRLIEGVRDFLDMLAGHDIPMAICSGALLPEIETILEGAGLRGHFTAIVSAEHVTKGKPDPEGFLLALDRLNAGRSKPILSKECAAIEDANWGLQAATKAGMHTVGVTNSYDAETLAPAEKIVDSLKELSLADLQALCR